MMIYWALSASKILVYPNVCSTDTHGGVEVMLLLC